MDLVDHGMKSDMASEFSTLQSVEYFHIVICNGLMMHKTELKSKQEKDREEGAIICLNYENFTCIVAHMLLLGTLPSCP